MSYEAAHTPNHPVSIPASANQVNAFQKKEVFEKAETKPLPNGLFIQPKLTVGAPDDPYEKEADAVADNVMRMPEGSFVEYKTAGSGSQNLQCKTEEEEEPLQLKRSEGTHFIQKKCAECGKEEKNITRKPLSKTVTPLLQPKSEANSEVTNSIARSIESSKGGGSSLDPNTHSFMSSRFGNDFSGVKIHTDSEAVQLNRELNAKAFTVGRDVYFNQGQYQPNSSEGKQLLAHELTHVVQQTGAVQTKLIQRKPAAAVQSPLFGSLQAPVLTAQPGGLQKEETKKPYNNGFGFSPKLTIGAPDDPFEKEADAVTDQVMRIPDKNMVQMKSPLLFQRQVMEVEEDGNLSLQRSSLPSFIQKKCEECGEAEIIHRQPLEVSYRQTSSNGDSTISTALASSTESSRGTGDHLNKEIYNYPSVRLSPEDVESGGFLDFIPDWIKDRARDIPGYTLFTVIIEYDPMFQRRVERTAINLLEGLMGLVPFGTAIFDKLIEYGIIPQVFDWVNSQLYQLNLTQQGLLNLLEEAWNETSFPYTDAIDKVREKLSQLLNRVETFALSLVDQIMQWVKEALVEIAEPFLEENRAWSLIKKIIRYDPLRDKEVTSSTVEILEDFLLLIDKETELEQMREKGTLQETADWLDSQVGTFLSLLDTLSGLIRSAWEAIQPENLPNIVENLQSIAGRAGTFLESVWNFAVTVAEKVLELVKDSLLGWLRTYAMEIPGYHLLTVILAKDVFTNEAVPREVSNIIRGFMSLMPSGESQFQQMQETGVIPQAAERIEALMSTLGISWEFIVTLFTDLWNSFSIQDLVNPIPAFQRLLENFSDPISRLFRFVIEVIFIMLELVLRLMNFPFEIIENIMNNAMAAFEDIRQDPIGFLMNMLETVKLGFTNFFGNILTHLSSGLSNWFFRQLEAAGITPPTEITLESILDVVIQVLGLSMDQIWQKLAERIGQENVDRIRGAIDRLTGIWTFIQDVQQRGMVAIWEYIQGQISNLWNMILEQATNWIIEQVINRVVTRLLSMLDPTGVMAVVNSFIAFFNAIQSAIDYFRDILEIIDSYVATVAAVARGELEPGAARLETGLANAIPVAIGFLANQVGLGNLAEKISEIIGTIRGYVDQGLDWLLDRAVSMGTAFLSALELGGDSPDEHEVGSNDDPISITESFNVEGGQHTLSFINGTNEELMIASRPTSYIDFLNSLNVSNDSNKVIAMESARGIVGVFYGIKNEANPDENQEIITSKRTRMRQQLNLLWQQTTILLEGQEGIPTGDTRDEPIPFTWYKNLNNRNLFPPITIGDQTFDIYDGPQRFEDPLSPGHPFRIGVNRNPVEAGGFGITQGSVIRRISRSRGDMTDQFRAVLEHLDATFGPISLNDAGVHIDHVLDLNFGGEDVFANMWPFDASANSSAGSRQNSQIITYRDSITGELRAVAAGHPSLINKFFIVEHIENV